jgi:hypothetical protein
MHSFTTIDLAFVQSDAHRKELSHVFHGRSSPPAGVRAALGRALVHAGLRILGHHEERSMTSASAVGS